MSNLNKMSGTPWHIEKIHRENGDERRHQSRCIYYQRDDKSCTKRMFKCTGSAHCTYYKEEKLETVVKSNTANKFTGILSNTKNEILPRDISVFTNTNKLITKNYITPIKTIEDKRKRISEPIAGNTYALSKGFFSSPALWDRYQYLLCCLEEKIIDCRLANGDEKLQITIRKDGMEIIQNIYKLICKETGFNPIIVQKMDYKFINNFYYPLQSYDSVKIAMEKCIYYRLNGKSPKIR